MNKHTADRIISEYLPKIYGFSVKHSIFYDEAEELSSDIVYELYTSLLKADEVYNTEGYVSRICRHVYAKYVAAKKKGIGVSLDNVDIPYEEQFYEGEADDELVRLRREVAFLTAARRKIVYDFYFGGKRISDIARETALSEGTVKWHLNKARLELKEGINMERKIGKLGLNPLTDASFGHSGNPGPHGRGPEYYISDRLALNIVYSVYHTPRTKEEIAEELGITPVFIEDKISFLEENGFLTPTAGGKYTTYVVFDPTEYSEEEADKFCERKLEAARRLIEVYVPSVRRAVSKYTDVYIPGGNRQLLEAAAIFYAVSSKCTLNTDIDLSRYTIKTADGGSYTAFANLPSTPTDPDYTAKHTEDYSCCGSMWRCSDKYPVSSWSVDNRYSSREGKWQNNLNGDYDYLYEYITGRLPDEAENREKLARLRERHYIGEDGRVNVMTVRTSQDDFFGSIPVLPDDVKREFADIALELAMARAKRYPAHMQDYVISINTEYFFGNTCAMMVLDTLYGDGTFKALTEDERITACLIMFSDTLPE